MDKTRPGKKMTNTNLTQDEKVNAYVFEEWAAAVPCNPSIGNNSTCLNNSMSELQNMHWTRS